MNDLKKVYLKDLAKEELARLVLNNNDFKNKVINDIYEENLFWQDEDYKQIFDNGVLYHDYYSSFYLTIKDYKTFIETTNFYFYDDSQNQKNKVSFVKKLQGKIESLEYKRDYEIQDDAYYHKIDNKIEKLQNELELKCDILLKDIEKKLHSYEECITDGELLNYILDFDYYGDFYTLNDGKIYQDLTKIYV